MNTAEKIAYTYLRLNGFLLLPQFTVFGGRSHNHVDLIGLRAANSTEQVGEFVFPLDDDFFNLISEILDDPLKQYLGLVAEVRTNSRREDQDMSKAEYIHNFLSGTPSVALAFFDANFSLRREDDLICISVPYALDWIVERIKLMERNMPGRPRKIGSWTLSDDYLSEILVLYNYGFLSSD